MLLRNAPQDGPPGSLLRSDNCTALFPPDSRSPQSKAPRDMRSALKPSRVIATLASIVLAFLLVSASLVISATPASAATETLFSASHRPKVVNSSSTRAVEVGMKFRSSSSGVISAVRFFKGSKNTGTHTVSLWTSTGRELAKAKATRETATGWQTVKFAKPVSITAGTTYVVSYHAPKGHFSYTRSAFNNSVTKKSITALARNNGVFRYGGHGFPASVSKQSTNYWVDVVFERTAAPATTTPTPTTPAPVPTTSAPAPTIGDRGCVSKPSSCGYPDATNTGVKSGVTLRRVPGEVTSGTGWTWDSRGWINAGSNAVVENLIVTGAIEVTGRGAVIRNNRITASGETWGVGLRRTSDVTVEHNTIGVIGTTRLMTGVKDVYGDSTGTKVIANNIANTQSGVQMGGGLIEGNYIHDMGYISGDHTNGVTSNGSTDQLTIRGNTILVQLNQTDAVGLFQDFGLEANRTVTGNLLAGGSYTVYGGAGSHGRSSNIKITNNRFSTAFFAKSGTYGPVAYFDASGSGNVWSGNIWDHNGSSVG